MAQAQRLLLANLFVALAYAATGWLGLQVPFAGEAVTLIWPPTGIAFAAIWRGGPRLLPGIFAGAAGLNLLMFGNPVFALLVGLGNCLPSLAAFAWLTRTRGERPLFDGPGGLVAFLVVPVLLSPMLSATVGTLAALAGGANLGEGIVSAWVSWWVGDAMGVLLVAPPLILMAAPGATALLRRRWVTALGLVVGGTVLLSAMALVEPLWLREGGRFALFCLILTAGLRLGLLGTAIYTLMVATGLTVMTARGLGPFAAADYHASFATLLAALSILSVAGLSLATVMATLRRVMLAEREARHQAEQALTRLCQTQDNLVQAEKMASLGRLVAGIAHEVNTPVGTALAAATRLANDTRGIEQALSSGTLRREQMNEYIDATSLAARILQSNMERAARLIESFKHVAVDRTRQDRRRFDLAGYLEEVVISLRPQTRKTPHAIALTGATRLSADTYPDAVAQLVTNLLVNAVTHAFPDGRSGRVELDLRADPSGWIELRVRDDGKGMAQDQLERIFEPFFTTGREKGGSGLGLYLAYSQVTQKLGGTLTVESSAPNQGTCFLARFPAVAPPSDQAGTPPAVPAPIDLAAKRRSA
ncbi:ATP-binding protein [Niveispirillum sp.]|uniref:ATP-binding protein n=1 Tax=Niveispirillum sp. TaxID=1917217 RepID=UPI001B57C000|nr:ATP-binding protein [Niveispirillum sp.]MBP7336350.1 MASE1 domain-containing protein [Niveispirillum sp.]